MTNKVDEMLSAINILGKRRSGLLIIFSLCWLPSMLVSWSCKGQHVFTINDAVDQHIFAYQNIESFEDPGGELTLDDILKHHQRDFKSSSADFNPENANRSSAYWYRIKLNHNPSTRKRWVIEFFDQTIDRIDFYEQARDGAFRHFQQGDQFEFNLRPLRHKNFVFSIDTDRSGEVTYFFRVYSKQQAEVIAVLRSIDYLFEYAIDEYFFFGIFYGMILVFSFYNLLMYLAVRESHYLYYILYLISIGLYEMSADGIGFQYLWPTAVQWNQYAPGLMLFMASSVALLFGGSLLNLRKEERWLFRLFVAVFIFRLVFLLLSIFIFTSWFAIRFVDVIPFAAALYAGIYRWRSGYKPARFLVIAYGFLFYGVVSKISLYFDFSWMPFGQLSHYSLSFCFVMEMLFLSFAISDKIRVLRLEKQVAQEVIIEQLHENQRLKDNYNQELEEQVKLKTVELLQKNNHIEEQNARLEQANKQLELQAAEIIAMNAFLAKDNDQLKHDVEEVKEARVLSKDVDFQEFNAMYPDDASCLKFLANRKWHDGYACRKCSHSSYSDGKSAYSRRCTKCGYEESVTAYTLLQNTRLPINKAFYLIFLVYSSRGSISSHKLSEILKIRQSTCWAYSSKIKKAMKERHKRSLPNQHEGWDALLLMEEVLF